MSSDNVSAEIEKEAFVEHLKNLNTDQINWNEKDESYWKSVLSPKQYEVSRKGGTETPFSGYYYKFEKDGNYYCSNCGQLLFKSDSKFDSGSGWPSFSELAKEGAVDLLKDSSHGMNRTEVKCSRCKAHLGHLFDDGPAPSRKRYCVNSVSIFHESDK